MCNVRKRALKLRFVMRGITSEKPDLLGTSNDKRDMPSCVTWRWDDAERPVAGYVVGPCKRTQRLALVSDQRRPDCVRPSMLHVASQPPTKAKCKIPLGV